VDDWIQPEMDILLGHHLPVEAHKKTPSGVPGGQPVTDPCRRRVVGQANASYSVTITSGSTQYKPTVPPAQNTEEFLVERGQLVHLFVIKSESVAHPAGHQSV
jgi:hypothetical protein